MNQLKQIDSFRRILADYRVSESDAQTLTRIRLVFLVGPSSSGRNTIIAELLQTGEYHYIVSDTTRQPRENNGVLEQNGREYWFRSEEELLADLEAGAFLEAAIIHNQQVSGISMRELATAADEGRIAISEIEVVGAAAIHDAKPDALYIFVVPPSFDEWMTRMRIRGTLPADETRRRLQSAVAEIRQGLAADFYHFVVNDTFKHTAKTIQALSSSSELPDDSPARAIAQQLLTDTEAFLATETDNLEQP